MPRHTRPWILLLALRALRASVASGTRWVLDVQEKWAGKRVSLVSLIVCYRSMTHNDIMMRMYRTIRLPGPDLRPAYATTNSGFFDTLASVPWFIVGVVGIAWEKLQNALPGSDSFRSRRGYRNVAVDEDAQVLRFEDEE